VPVKILTIFSVVQTLLIVFILFSVKNLGSRIDAAGKTPAIALPQESVIASHTGTQAAASPGMPDEGRIRQIIREELRSHLKVTAAPPQASAEFAPEPVSPAEYEYRLQAVMQELDYHIKQGEISDMDMTRFQGEIARLDEDGRRQMLRLLVQALNSGELEGRF